MPFIPDIMFAGKTNARDDIGSTRTASDNGWPPVNHGVRNSSGGVITLLARTE